MTAVSTGTALVARQIPPFGGQTAYVADLAGRRSRILTALGPDTVLVLWSAPPKVYSTDTNYEYRQESNLLYLTGVATDPVVLVLVPGGVGAREFLFIPAADPFRELWYGRTPTPSEIAERSGIPHVFPQRGSEAFDAFMRGLLAAPASGPVPGDSPAELAGRAASPGGDRLRLAVLESDRMGGAIVSGGDGVSSRAGWFRQIQSASFRPISLRNAETVLLAQRQIKTPYEQQVLRHSVDISAAAHIEGMRVTRPGRWEYEVEAAIEHWFLKSGALSWGYPSIVASGPNATTLHYISSTRQTRPGELLLVDAAANFQGLTGDITRTYPVSRRFSPDQRELYELVLAAEEAGIAAARPGGRIEDITRAVRATVGVGLLRLGLVTDPDAATGDSPQVDIWFPHSPVHGIGVDVHDPLGRLDPGAAFVVEPGIYIRTDTLERLAADPATAGFARAVRPAVERYRDVGIRVEDSLLMTPSGPENLSRRAPRLVRDIERVVGTGR
jgi:Xaa-Pro aminopeptidase